jgi:hypothetical protein
MKNALPCVLFSGKFVGRKDSDLIEPSSLIVLDFDNVPDPDELKQFLFDEPFILASWISPSGNGVKALAVVTDPNKHREHFNALASYFQPYTADKSGVNVSRVCFESYDPEILVKESDEYIAPFPDTEETFTRPDSPPSVPLKSDDEKFNRMLTWLANKGNSFQKGERNLFIFKLASACCRIGIPEERAKNLIASRFETSSDFQLTELHKTVTHGYKTNIFASAELTNERFYTVSNNEDVDSIDGTPYNDLKPKDVIWGESVEEQSLSIYLNGYENVKGIGVPDIDDRWKMRRGDLTVLSGIGNYGKSTFLKWMLLMRSLKYDEKWALFAPEDNPAHEFYHDLVEILLACELTPNNPNKPTQDDYLKAYRWVSSHFFFIYPAELTPTPEYVKERFLELIVKEKIDGVIIDPFNQLTNDYNRAGGRTDKYLEFVLSDFSRFAQQNNVYFTMVAHPHKLQKDGTGNYPCPDVFDLADGAMWNNKSDNIVIFHRPQHQTNPTGTDAELHSKKIRRQKTVGKKGLSAFTFDWSSRRFLFGGLDPMRTLIGEQFRQCPRRQSVTSAPPEPYGYTSVKPVVVRSFTEPKYDRSDEQTELRLSALPKTNTTTILPDWDDSSPPF